MDIPEGDPPITKREKLLSDTRTPPLFTQLIVMSPALKFPHSGHSVLLIGKLETRAVLLVIYSTTHRSSLRQ